MKLMRVKLMTQLTICGVILFFSVYAAGSPSGLNNIPTSDVTPGKVLVLQSWGNFSHGAAPSWMGGLKYGLLKGVEIGIDRRLGSDGNNGPLTFQTKLQIPGPWESISLKPLIGIANLSDDTDAAGKADPYAVLTHENKFYRLHLGYSFQKDNQAMFMGLDKTFKFMSRDLVLRGDIRQVADGDELLWSIGLLYELPYNFVLESWGSFPSADRDEKSLTIKLNYVISF